MGWAALAAVAFVGSVASVSVPDGEARPAVPTAADAQQVRPTLSGTWNGRFRADAEQRPGRISLARDVNGRNRSQNDLPEGVVRAVLDQAGANDGVVTYELRGEAGTLRLEGRIRGTRGMGAFTFMEDPGFRDSMADLGYRGLDEDDVYAAAVHDVGRARVQELRGLGLGTMDWGDLMSAAIFDVDAAFVQEMRSLGVDIDEMDDAVAFRIHGVTPAFVREARSSGIGTLDGDDLVAMRIHGVTPEFMEAADAMGFDGLDFDDLVAMRIHGVSATWVDGMAREGFRFDDVEDALAFRIHGITPEFLQELREAGFDELDVDDVLRIKIHGLDRIIRRRRG
jgi:hypothetical protein